jgi:mono/diheme cytochrome c family protein
MTRKSSIITWLLGAAVVIGVIAVIAASMLIGNGSHGSGSKFNASERNGRQLFAQNCSTCHALAAANAVGRVGPNLDQLKPPKALVLDAIKNGRARGVGQMPAGLVQGQDAQDVAAFVDAATH